MNDVDPNVTIKVNRHQDVYAKMGSSEMKMIFVFPNQSAVSKMIEAEKFCLFFMKIDFSNKFNLYSYTNMQW